MAAKGGLTAELKALRRELVVAQAKVAELPAAPAGAGLKGGAT